MMIQVCNFTVPKRGRPKKRPEERVRTYDPRVPMQCDECGKVLKGTGALRVHKQIHQNVSLFKFVIFLIFLGTCYHFY